MSEYYHHHENNIHLFKPYGLHLIWYRCILNESEKMTSKKEIIRNCERLIKSRDFYLEIQCVYF